MSEESPDKLYRYFDTVGGFATIKESSIRCSSPVLFNDPFDGDFLGKLGFSHDELDDYKARKALEYANGGQSLPETAGEGFVDLVNRVKAEKLDGKSDDEVAKHEVATSRIVRALARSGSDSVEFPDLRKILRGFRIASFSEANDSAMMWAHYADAHRGMCLEFTKPRDPSNVFSLAEKVQYVEALPELVSLEEWGDFTCGLGGPDLFKFIMSCLTHKGQDWSYEREWRVVLPQVVSDDLRFNLPFAKQELTAVYLGLRAQDVDLYRLEAIREHRDTKFKIFRAKKNEAQFKLDFVEHQ